MTSRIASRVQIACAAAGVALLPALAGAQVRSFHVMQVEQVTGGVNGDPAAQAIQLRMRTIGQNLVSNARIRAFDAQGNNPILITDFGSNVPNASQGDRVLIATPAMAAQTTPAMQADFIMANPIPPSYLAAGRIIFESDFPSDPLWSLAWGGAGYTGSNDGDFTNDDDGDFGPPFDGPLPSTGVEALRFLGGPADGSTRNIDDYALTTGAAVWTNNARNSFTINGAVCLPDFNGDGSVTVADFLAYLTAYSEGDPRADMTGDGVVNVQDFLAFLGLYAAGC